MEGSDAAARSDRPGVARSFSDARILAVAGAVLAVLAATLAFVGDERAVGQVGPRRDSAPAEAVPVAVESGASLRRVLRVLPQTGDEQRAEDRDRERPRWSDGPAGARSERDFLLELRALARSDPAAFHGRADRVLAGDGPACEQVAVLRAAYAEAWPAAADLFARALLCRPDRSGPEGESVPTAALLWLAARAPREARARELLASLVWHEPTVLASDRRMQALRPLVLSSPEDELPALERRIAAERDRLVHECGAAALREREGGSAALAEGV